MLNGWKININTQGMPQKVATAFAGLNELVGAEYEFIAYLGEQVVNGINHAVLARQTIVTGRDTENVVVVTFNEKPADMECSLVSIERVVEGGLDLGGVHVDPATDIPDDAANAFAQAFDGYVGAKVTPVALLGTQVVKGTNYIFAVEAAPVVPNAESKVAVVTVNPMIGSLTIANLLTNKHEVSLGYAFTWLKGGMGKPLGEWP